MKITNISKIVAILMGSVLLSTNSFAFHWFRSNQSPPPNVQSIQMPRLDRPNQPAPTSAPFDGGLTLFVAAGIGYASKKRFDKRKQMKEANTVL